MNREKKNRKREKNNKERALSIFVVKSIQDKTHPYRTSARNNLQVEYVLLDDKTNVRQ